MKKNVLFIILMIIITTYKLQTLLPNSNKKNVSRTKAPLFTPTKYTTLLTVLKIPAP